jgi:hypothetical protein
MFPLTVNDLLLTISSILFLLGIVGIGAGVVILVTKVMGGDIKLITAQASDLAKKGIAEDVSGLVGNASKLIDSLNDLVRTATGVGIFLVIIGFVLMMTAYYLLIQIN